MSEADLDDFERKLYRWFEAEAMAEHYQKAAKRYWKELHDQMDLDVASLPLDPQEVALAALRRRSRGPVPQSKPGRKTQPRDELPRPIRRRSRN